MRGQLSASSWRRSDGEAVRRDVPALCRLLRAHGVQSGGIVAEAHVACLQSARAVQYSPRGSLCQIRIT